jgi:hypothetical protein
MIGYEHPLVIQDHQECLAQKDFGAFHKLICVSFVCVAAWRRQPTIRYRETVRAGVSQNAGAHLMRSEFEGPSGRSHCEKSKRRTHLFVSWTIVSGQ